jgi:hypothetical protein
MEYYNSWIGSVVYVHVPAFAIETSKPPKIFPDYKFGSSRQSTSRTDNNVDNLKLACYWCDRVTLPRQFLEPHHDRAYSSRCSLRAIGYILVSQNSNGEVNWAAGLAWGEQVTGKACGRGGQVNDITNERVWHVATSILKRVQYLNNCILRLPCMRLSDRRLQCFLVLL